MTVAFFSRQIERHEMFSLTSCVCECEYTLQHQHCKYFLQNYFFCGLLAWLACSRVKWNEGEKPLNLHDDAWMILRWYGHKIVVVVACGLFLCVWTIVWWRSGMDSPLWIEDWITILSLCGTIGNEKWLFLGSPKIFWNHSRNTLSPLTTPWLS